MRAAIKLELNSEQDHAPTQRQPKEEEIVQARLWLKSLAHSAVLPQTNSLSCLHLLHMRVHSVLQTLILCFVSLSVVISNWKHKFTVDSIQDLLILECNID